MKTLCTIFIFLMLTPVLVAQNVNYGLKAGVNYNFSGDLTDKNEMLNTGDDVIHGAKNSLGYHGGIFLKWELSKFFIKTEANYTQYDTNYPVLQNNLTLTTQKVDVPLLLGVDLVGPAYIFAGPDLQYTIRENFSLDNTEVHYNDFTWGLHIGIGAQVSDFSFEIRWDKALNTKETEVLNNLNLTDYYTIDTRPNQLLFSIGYQFD